MSVGRFILLVFALFALKSSDVSAESNLKDSRKIELRDISGHHLARKNFKCPSIFGAFPDTDDCAYFYICMQGRGKRTKCPPLTLFDKNLRRCMPRWVATCDDGKDDVTTHKPSTTERPKDEKFRCPGMMGNFMHPTDCSKYYRCTFFFPILNTCPDSELFDGVKKECKPAAEVHCGDRIRPGETTKEPETTSEVITESTTVLEPETTTLEETTTVFEPESSTLEETTPETTTRPTGPPDTDCDEDDLDCIITDTGEKPEWFECPEDVGSYTHPSSNKLFIFCLNWKPSVKKCGQDLVYSNDYGTCVSPDEADYVNEF